MASKSICPYLANLVNPDCRLNPDLHLAMEQIDLVCGSGNYFGCGCYLYTFIPGSRQSILAKKLVRSTPETLEKSAYELLRTLPEPTDESWGHPEHQRPFVEDPRKL